MRDFLFVLAVLFLASLGIARARPNASREKAKNAQATPDAAKIPQEDMDRKNPVKPTPEGLASARKVYGYDCAMCHGEKGDGKGDLVESMKLTVLDWRRPSSLEGKTDGELFYIITKGKGKMVGEGDRVSETMRWNFVNLVRSFSKKEESQKPGS